MRAVLVLAGVVVAVSIAAASAGDSERAFTDSFDVDAAEWASSGTNPYFVLEPGYRMEFAGKEDGKPAALVITVLAETKQIAGVETRVVEERETKDGEVKEVSRNYFAISKRTNGVYYFGEDVDTYEDGKVAGHGGSWHAGLGGAKFGLTMPGTVLLGSRYFQEVAEGVAMDRAEITDMAATVETPAGKFEKCLVVEETTPLEKGKEHKRYARGVGLLVDGALRLVKYGSGGK